MWNATQEYSDHASRGITELEVFTGAIFNKSGAQTRRQREKSPQLKDEFDRIARWAEAMIRNRKMKVSSDSKDEQEYASTDSDEGLILSIACLNVGVVKQHKSLRAASGRFEDNFQSFKVVAACCAVRELDAAFQRGSR